MLVLDSQEEHPKMGKYVRQKNKISKCFFQSSWCLGGGGVEAWGGGTIQTGNWFKIHQKG